MHCLPCCKAIDYCSTSATVALSAVQYNDRFLFYQCYSWTVCCAVQRQIAILRVLKWHCLLCSTAIDCSSTGAAVELPGVQYSDRLLFYLSSLTAWNRAILNSNTVKMEETIFGHSPDLCLHIASCNQLSATFQASVYIQLHLTICRPH
jgi:hypothetical protein